MVSIRRRKVYVLEGKSFYIQAYKLKRKLQKEEAAAARIQKNPKKHKSRRKKYTEQLGSLRGVYFKNLKWQAAIKVDKKQVHLGTLPSKEDAAHLYDRAAYLCGREPNFPLSDETKQQLDMLSWNEFIALIKNEVANKRMVQKGIEVCTQAMSIDEP